MRIAVIVTTYNRPDALLAVLNGYLAQTDLNFELIVADDGSCKKTQQVIDDFKLITPLKITHVWHEDKGFRAAAIRNRAILVTNADYIILTDGDCIPLPHFVASHRLLAEHGYFVSGNRILASQELTQQLLQATNQPYPISAWHLKKWIVERLKGRINRLLPLITLPKMMGKLRYLDAFRWQGAKTCNLGVWRTDLLTVNGLDEAYSGWGMEDSDLVIRLLHANILNKSGRCATPVLHLWHKENDRSGLQKNIEQLNELIASNRIKAQIGLDRY